MDHVSLWYEIALALRHLTPLSALDILLVAAILYQCLLLVRGTRASQVLLGIFLLVLAYYGSDWGGLTLLHWLLSTALPYFFIAILVLFQAEIRNGLAKIGRQTLGLARDHASGESYEDIVLAANYFSSHKQGALMVLERRTGLRTYIESGVPLNAHLSYDLLVTIFRPGAPLHDGAVVIQANRIAAAACFLPISTNPLLSPQWGTRHRAAIGISEETDAVAIAVSEAHGGISLAVGGKLESELSVERLRQRLGELFRQYLPPLALPTSQTPTPPGGASREMLS